MRRTLLAEVDPVRFARYRHIIELRFHLVFGRQHVSLASLDMKLEVSDAVLGELAKVGFDPLYGARPLKRAIQSSIENPLAKDILEGRFAPKDVIAVDFAAGRFTFSGATPGKRAKAA